MLHLQGTFAIHIGKMDYTELTVEAMVKILDFKKRPSIENPTLLNGDAKCVNTPRSPGTTNSYKSNKWLLMFYKRRGGGAHFDWCRNFTKASFTLLLTIFDTVQIIN